MKFAIAKKNLGYKQYLVLLWNTNLQSNEELLEAKQSQAQALQTAYTITCLPTNHLVLVWLPIICIKERKCCYRS